MATMNLMVEKRPILGYFRPLGAPNIPKEWSWKVALNHFFVYLIEIYKMSYINICFLEFILRPISDLFWAILDLWVLLIPQRSDPGRLPSITFLFVSLRSTKWAIESRSKSKKNFNHHLSPPPSINRKSIYDVDVSYYLNLVYFKVNWIRNTKINILIVRNINIIEGQNIV